jgi:hypothetical protein
LPAIGIVECPIQETPLGKGILNASHDHIKFSVQKLEVIMDYSNVTNFGINNMRVILTIRNDHAAE